MAVYKEQNKATMVDQELDEAKVVEGEWHTKFKAPYHHKLDGVGPVDNRPSTNKLHHFVEEKKKEKRKKEETNCDM